MPRFVVVAVFRHTNPFLMMTGLLRLLTWRPLGGKTLLQRVRVCTHVCVCVCGWVWGCVCVCVCVCV
jgi:hypothetical protein